MHISVLNRTYSVENIFCRERIPCSDRDVDRETDIETDIEMEIDTDADRQIQIQIYI